jgi:hypothetical protein
MWLRKQINRATYWATLRETANQSELQRMRGEVSCFDHRLLPRLNMRTACTDTVLTEVRSILKYAYDLRSLSGLDWSLEGLDRAPYGFSLNAVTIERFFYTQAGVLLNPLQESLGFKLAVLQFMDKFEGNSRNADEQYHRRILKPLLLNAVGVVKTLRHHSLQL